MNSEQNLTREEAIAILNTPDEQLNELIKRAGALRKKNKGNHVSIHLLTNARSGNCSQNCAYCAQSCRSHADIEKYKWVDDEKLYGDNTFVHDHKLSRHCIGLCGMKFSDDERRGYTFMLLYRIFNKEAGLNVKRSWIRPYQP